jgi:HSP20 family protein
MNGLTRWDPFRELRVWNDRMNRIFSNELPARREEDETLLSGAWMPPVDIVETKDKINLNIELPGFRENQVDLTIEDGVLTVKGERKFEKKDNEENYHRIERAYGSFVRSFTLPTSVEQSRINANFADGVLHIDMPKREETKPKQIRISAGSGEGKKDIDVKKSPR